MDQFRRMLEIVDFGFDVAENDKYLNDYFIETNAFSTIISGNVDVIRGHKGMGKSAIYKILLSGSHTIPNTSIVSGSDATNSSIFFNSLTVTLVEDQFRLLWAAYFAQIVANKTIEDFDETAENRELLKQVKEFLKTFGLKKETNKLSFMEKVKATKKLGFGLGMAENGLPSLNFNIEFDSENKLVSLSEEDFYELISICIAIYKQQGKSLWILIDRLDTLYQKNATNETNSFRGLLRVHLNICAIGGGQDTVVPKIFVRTDIYQRITKTIGFTNITHLRDLNIIWNARSITHLIIKRVTSSSEVVRILDSLGISVDEYDRIWDCLLPEKIQSHKSHVWIVNSTSDSSGAYSPRNFITLLTLAKNKAIDLTTTNPRSFGFDTVLSSDSILSSFGELSRKRLDDTVLAEFPDVRPYVDHLRGGRATFESRQLLIEQLGSSLNNEGELDRIIDRLNEVGLLKIITAESFAIPFLYRPALKTGRETRSADK